MKKVHIVHSRGAHPNDFWYPAAAHALEGANFTVKIPQMPNPESPKKTEWLAALEPLQQEIDENTYLLGHSVGCQAVLRTLDSLPEGVKCGGVVLVAGWVSVPAWEGRTDEEKAVLNDWMNPPLDLRRLAETSKRFTAIFSDNDEFVPPENWKACEEQLHAKVIVKHAAGHFEGKNDLQLPEVVDAILEMSQVADD
jgi:predicted alpha/beta hydrolase family esterase